MDEKLDQKLEVTYNNSLPTHTFTMTEFRQHNIRHDVGATMAVLRTCPLDGLAELHEASMVTTPPELTLVENQKPW